MGMRLSHGRQTDGNSSYQETNWTLSQVKINCCVFQACWTRSDPDQLWEKASGWLPSAEVEVGRTADLGGRKVSASWPGTQQPS